MHSNPTECVPSTNTESAPPPLLVFSSPTPLCMLYFLPPAATHVRVSAVGGIFIFIIYPLSHAYYIHPISPPTPPPSTSPPLPALVPPVSPWCVCAPLLGARGPPASTAVPTAVTGCALTLTTGRHCLSISILLVLVLCPSPQLPMARGSFTAACGAPSPTPHVVSFDPGSFPLQPPPACAESSQLPPHFSCYMCDGHTPLSPSMCLAFTSWCGAPSACLTRKHTLAPLSDKPLSSHSLSAPLSLSLSLTLPLHLSPFP